MKVRVRFSPMGVKCSSIKCENELLIFDLSTSFTSSQPGQAIRMYHPRAERPSEKRVWHLMVDISDRINFEAS
jgi:hypothetical protein